MKPENTITFEFVINTNPPPDAKPACYPYVLLVKTKDFAKENGLDLLEYVLFMIRASATASALRTRKGKLRRRLLKENMFLKGSISKELYDSYMKSKTI
jgi:hypothetical protein